MTNQWSPKGQTIRLGDRGLRQPLPSLSQPIRLVGDGPCVASTSHDIERQPFCWDTNGFYRRLGLPPGAPRIEVARAYMDLDGHRSIPMTNAAEVLLNRRTKPLYDALPLGTLWPNDVLLVEAVLSGDFEVAKLQDDDWAFYVDSIDPSVVDRDQLGVWRFMIAYLLWRAHSPATHFAMGARRGDGNVSVVGFRLVAFVPVDSKPAWEYCASIAQELQRAAIERVAFSKR